MRGTFTTSVLVLCGSLAACGDNLEEEVNEETASKASSLTGSSFEIDEPSANLVVDGMMGSLDWANVAEVRQNDLTTGQNDNSYGGGAKEDDPCPTVGTGSIPNNKSDLKSFAVYQEPGATAGDPGFLHLMWTRVQDPTGTTLMDFEFNQSSTKCANGVNPVRTPGDFLIEYKIDQGGVRAELVLRIWSGTAWGPEQALENDAIGTINQDPITNADSAGYGALSARTFGEASIDLSVIFDEDSCTSFGSAFVKSRSSDSFTSALKDFIAPTPISLTNCGKVIIRKETVPDALTDSFSFTHNLQTDPAQSGTTFSLTDGTFQQFTNVLFGTGYSVTETVPTNFTLSIDCSASTGVTPTIGTTGVTFDIDDDADIVDCTFTNTRQTGSILITKTRKHAATGSGNYPHAGVNFTVTGGNLPMAGTVVTTNALGQACIEGLNFASYTVAESVPTGYVAVGDATKTVSVTAVGDCDDAIANEATVSFQNMPLTDITVSVNSQINGGTASTISCTPSGSASTGSNGDGSLTLSNLVPGTYVCTVVVDP